MCNSEKVIIRSHYAEGKDVPNFQESLALFLFEKEYGLDARLHTGNFVPEAGLTVRSKLQIKDGKTE